MLAGTLSWSLISSPWHSLYLPSLNPTYPSFYLLTWLPRVLPPLLLRISATFEPTADQSRSWISQALQAPTVLTLLSPAASRHCWLCLQGRLRREAASPSPAASPLASALPDFPLCQQSSLKCPSPIFSPHYSILPIRQRLILHLCYPEKHFIQHHYAHHPFFCSFIHCQTSWMNSTYLHRHSVTVP